jgi:hypothetical protein
LEVKIGSNSKDRERRSRPVFSFQVRIETPPLLPATCQISMLQPAANATQLSINLAMV